MLLDLGPLDHFEPPPDHYPYHHNSQAALIPPALIVVATLVTLFVFASGVLVGAVFL